MGGTVPSRRDRIAVVVDGPRTRRWTRLLGGLLVVFLLVFFGGGGWYFSGLIRSDALLVEESSPEYDFTVHRRMPETRRVEPRPLIIIDGILVLAEPELRDLMDIRVFVDTDSDIRFIRRLGRDTKKRGRTVESVVRQYQQTVRPMHLEFVAPSRRHAHIIVPEGGKNEVAIGMLVARLRYLVARGS